MSSAIRTCLLALLAAAAGVFLGFLNAGFSSAALGAEYLFRWAVLGGFLGLTVGAHLSMIVALQLGQRHAVLDALPVGFVFSFLAIAIADLLTDQALGGGGALFLGLLGGVALASLTAQLPPDFFAGCDDS